MVTLAFRSEARRELTMVTLELLQAEMQERILQANKVQLEAQARGSTDPDSPVPQRRLIPRLQAFFIHAFSRAGA